jgi:general secretion pathway protein F
MQFRVKSLQPLAGVCTTVLEAASAADAAQQLSALGHAVVSVQPVSRLRFAVALRKAQFPLLLFSQELLALLDSGINVVESIETLAEKESRPDVRAVLGTVLSGLREGKPFSATLQELPAAFPALYVATVRASERTGGLSEALVRYIAYASQLEVLRGRLVSAAIYPVLLIGVSTLVILFLMGYVVPRFSHIYEDLGNKLPVASQILLVCGQAVAHYWPLMLGGVAALGFAIAAGAGQALRARAVQWLWRIPAVGERMRVFQLARLYRTLGMLLRAGIAVVPALDMVAGLLSPVLQPRLQRATRQIREGQAISIACEDAGLTTAVATRMLRVGERAGNMGDMMERIAAFHDDEMARWAEWATRLIGPVLMLVMGVLIGAIVVLMYLPIFQLAESIQ